MIGSMKSLFLEMTGLVDPSFIGTIGPPEPFVLGMTGPAGINYSS
jgi:hypothetical protein